MDEAILKTLQKMEERRARRQDQVDEEQLFGQHVAAVLRRLTGRQKATARLRIEQVLIDVEFPEETQVNPPAFNFGY